MSGVRGEIWPRRMGKKNVTNAPDLTSLPPIKESFDENVKHANVQTSIWKSALNQQPPYLYPAEYRWEHDEQVLNSYNTVDTCKCCSERGAGINTVWLCNGYTMCNSNVCMLQSSLVMYNTL